MTALLERLEKSLKRHKPEREARLLGGGKVLSVVVRGKEYALDLGRDNAEAAFILELLRRAIIDAGRWPVETPHEVILFDAHVGWVNLISGENMILPTTFYEGTRTERWIRAFLAVYPEEA